MLLRKLRSYLRKQIAIDLFFFFVIFLVIFSIKDVFMNSFVMSLEAALGGPLVRLMGGQAGGEGGGSAMFSFLPLVAIIAVFYFLILRPQSKKQKETQKMLSALRKGDRVITIGGIHGVIQSVKDSTIIVKVDDNVKLEFNRAAISTVSSSGRDDDKEEKSGETEEKKE